MFVFKVIGWGHLTGSVSPTGPPTADVTLDLRVLSLSSMLGIAPTFKKKKIKENFNSVTKI